MQFLYEVYTFAGSSNTGLRLEKVVDSLGRDYNFEYEGGTDRLSSVTDFANRRVQYVYFDQDVLDFGLAFDLMEVHYFEDVLVEDVDPSKVWSFDYYTESEDDDLNNLRTVYAPNGDTLLVNEYYTDPEATGRIREVITGQTLAGERYDYVYLAKEVVGETFIRPVLSINRSGHVKRLEYSPQGQFIARYDYAGMVDPEHRAEFIDNLWQANDPGSQTSIVMPTSLGGSLPTPQERYLAPVRGSSEPIFVKQTVGYADTTRLNSRVLPNGESISTTYENVATGPSANPLKWQNVTERTRTTTDTTPLTITEEWEYAAGLGSGGCGCGSTFATKHVDGNGNVTTWTYNDFGDPLSIKRWDPGEVTLLSEENFTYDSYGRMTTHTHPKNGNGSNRRVDKYDYWPTDDNLNLGRRGKVKKVTVDFGKGRSNLTTEYDYDDYGNVASITDPKGNVTHMMHDWRGLLLETTEPIVDINGTDLRRYQTKYYHDVNDKLVRVDSGIVLDDEDDPIGTMDEGYELVRRTFHDYDALGQRIRTCREVTAGILSIPPDQMDCLGLTADTNGVDLTVEAAFVTEEFAYDPNQNLVLVRKGEATAGFQAGNVISRVYDQRNMLFTETRGVTTGVHSTTRFDYDGNRNLVARIEGYGSAAERTTEFAYDGFDRLRLVTDPEGNTAAYTYDNNYNRLTELRSGPAAISGGSFELAYTEFEYDDMDRLVETRRHLFDVAEGHDVTDPVALTSRTFNEDSSVASVTILRGTSLSDTTTYEYDLVGRLTKTIDPQENEVHYTYDDNGNTLTVMSRETESGTDEDFIVTYTYDTLNRVVLTVDGVGNETASVYDSRGNVVEMVDARERISEYTYDGLSRLLTTTRHGSGTAPDFTTIVTSQVWDYSSRLIAQIDDNGMATRYAYDELDRLRGTLKADGTQSQVGSGLTWASTASLRPSSYGTSGYDGVGNPVGFVDANWSSVTSTFDDLGRVTARSITRGSGVIGTTSESYWYDGLSRVLRAENNETRVERKYDTLSRIIEETTTLWDGGLEAWVAPLTVEYEHDLAGNVTQLTYPGGRVVTQEFDGLHRLAEITSTAIDPMDPDFVLATYAYAGPGRVNERTLGNGTETLYGYNGIDGVANVTGDDGFAQVAKITHQTIGMTPTILDERDLKWDPTQNKLSFEIASSPVVIRSFEYDSASRLVTSKRKEGTGATVTIASYDLDGVHNRAEVNGLLISGAQIGEYTMSTGGPGYDVYVNQYTTTPESRIEYDTSGNLIRYEAQSSGGMTLDLMQGEGQGPQSVRDSAADAIALGGLALDFTADQQVDAKDAEVALELLTTGGIGGLPRVATLRYDYRNQMVEYEDDEYLLNPTVYVYDCFGRRVMKKVYNPAAYVPANIRYVSGGNTRGTAMWQTLEEWDVDEEEVYVSYVYGNYIDEVLSMRKDIDGAGETHDVEEYYFHADDLFNVVLITDESGGAVERYEYGDYGAPFYYDGSGDWIPHSVLNNTRLFNGREWDQETRFYYYRTRYMEPTMGRFTTRDSIGVWGDPANVGNGVAYVASSPFLFVDPLGETLQIISPDGPDGRNFLKDVSDLLNKICPSARIGPDGTVSIEGDCQDDPGCECLQNLIRSKHKNKVQPAANPNTRPTNPEGMNPLWIFPNGMPVSLPGPGSGTDVGWNPDLPPYMEQSDQTGKIRTIPREFVLAHELCGHAPYMNMGFPAAPDQSYWDNYEERVARHQENIIRKSKGFPSRSNNRFYQPQPPIFFGR